MARRAHAKDATNATSPSVGRSDVLVAGVRIREQRCGRLAFDARSLRLVVVANRQHTIETLANGFDVRDDDDLLETIVQALEKLDHVVPPVLVERAEHLVEDEERERLTRALGD